MTTTQDVRNDIKTTLGIDPVVGIANTMQHYAADRSPEDAYRALCEAQTILNVLMVMANPSELVAVRCLLDSIHAGFDRLKHTYGE